MAVLRPRKTLQLLAPLTRLPDAVSGVQFAHSDLDFAHAHAMEALLFQDQQLSRTPTAALSFSCTLAHMEGGGRERRFLSRERVHACCACMHACMHPVESHAMEKWGISHKDCLQPRTRASRKEKPSAREWVEVMMHACTHEGLHACNHIMHACITQTI